MVVTLSLMILLTILAVGMLSLSSISLRNSSNSQLMQEARQNARLALMLAIGELQSTTGPDQRVTAPAEIRGTTALPPAQPHLTGVWQGWKWDGTSTADYEDKKESQFLRWLVSTRDTATASDLSFAENAPTGDIVTLVKGIRRALVVLFPNPKNPKEPYRSLVLDHGLKGFPLGVYRLINVSPYPVRGIIGRETAQVKPGGIAQLELMGEPGATAQMRFEFFDKNRWNLLTESRCAIRKDRRWLACIYSDPATGRMNIRSIPDRTATPAATPAPEPAPN